MSYKVKSTYRPPGPDPREVLVACARAQAECAAGRHAEETVPATRVVYGPYGRRRRTGDRYCPRCGTDLPKDGDDGQA